MTKPMIAPGSEPVSRPTDITTSGVRSALTPKIEICEIDRLLDHDGHEHEQRHRAR